MGHVDRLREICLDYPRAVEKVTWGHPTFRVNNKMFVSCSAAGTDRPTMTVKMPPGEQELLLATGDPFFYPAYVGAKGWIGIKLSNSTDWREIGELVDDSYRSVAPKRLLKELDA